MSQDVILDPDTHEAEPSMVASLVAGMTGSEETGGQEREDSKARAQEKAKDS
jgi:hypothetical protein